MLRELDNFYFDKEEPNRGCLMALRDIIRGYNSELLPAWKYRLPCFMYKNQIFCYLWIDKKLLIHT